MPAEKLTVVTGQDADTIAQKIFGAGVEIVGASLSNTNGTNIGIYSDGDSVSPDATPEDTGVIFSTGRASDFTNASGQENQSTFTGSNSAGVDGDAGFDNETNANTFDAAYIDVDFRPDGDTLTMQFVFSSEEYPEFINSIFQDYVGVWVNGSPVDLVVGNGDVDPGNVNEVDNQNLYLDNTTDAFNTEMDGLTITLSLKANVTPGAVNSIRIGVADVADNRYDSNLLIAADSVQTVLLANTDTVSMHPGGQKTIDVLDNDVGPTGNTLTITEINGQAVVVGSVVTLNSGSQVELTADGKLKILGDGDTEDYNFTYQISDGVNTDTGFVNVSQVPCFVAGTLITTKEGDVPVETLSPGDLVLTKDEGFQPLRWIGTRTVDADGSLAPIEIAADTFGKHGALKLSPLHRVLVKDAIAELLFAESEVLIAAKDLVNDTSVRRCLGQTVTYVHLLFDRHQVVYSEGLATESFLPGPQTTNSFEQDITREICAIFPEIDPETGLGYGPSARRALKRHEAHLMAQVGTAA